MNVTVGMGANREILRFCALICLVAGISAFANFDKSDSEVDLDKLVEFTLKCFWTIMCELNEPLKIKACMEPVHKEEILFGINALKPWMPEHIQKQVNLTAALSDKFWVEVLQPEACNMPKDKRDEATNDVNIQFHQHYSSLCFEKMLYDRCQGVTMVSETYNKLQSEKYASGECHA